MLPGVRGGATAKIGQGTAQFVIEIPSKVSAAGVRPQYVSPATQSISIAITGSAAQTLTANLTPTSTGCSSSLASTTCTLAIALGPGTYTATVATYDGADETGALLSQGQDVGFSIVAGTANAISLTLSGVPASILLESANAQTSRSASNAFTLGGIFAAPMYALALDADGNIITGPGAPTFTIAQSSGAAFTIANPVATSPNRFTLAPPGPDGSTGAFIATATYRDDTCAQVGAVCTADFNVASHTQSLIVDDDGPVVVLAPPYTGSPATLSGYSASAGFPGIAAFDAVGNLWIVDNAAQDIKEYASPYTGSPVTTIGDTTFRDPIPVVIDPKTGDMFVGSFTNGTVYVYAPPYAQYSAPDYAPPTATITSGIDGPIDLAVDGSDNLYVANNFGSNITKYAPPYTGGSLVSNLDVADAGEVAVTSAGDIFAISLGADTIEHWAFANGAYSEADIAGGSGIGAMTVGPSQQLFVGETGTNRIDIYQPPYTSISSSFANDLGGAMIAFDAGDSLFAADANTLEDYGFITAFAPPYTSRSALISTGMPTGLYLSP